MIPTIPVSVWDQISIVVIFSLLLAGMGYLIAKLFTKAIADINEHYAKLLIDANMQWQKYFDARAESNLILTQKLTDRMDQIALVLSNLVTDFRRHDDHERQTLNRIDEQKDRDRHGPTDKA